MCDLFSNFTCYNDFYRLIFQTLCLVDRNSIGNLEWNNVSGIVVVFIAICGLIHSKSNNRMVIYRIDN